jgi:hypothetical protein
MKANELRIGNYINNEQRTELVRAVDNWRIQCHLLTDKKQETLYEVSIHLIKPIPLTEQWLIDFGFKKDEDLGDIIYYQKEKYGVCLDHDELVFYATRFKNEVYNIIYDDDIFQSVHQLQNLYFALTGKELKKKL